MTDKYCPLRFREYDSNPHDQRCIGDYCAWYGKCSQSHGEPRTDTVETQTRVRTETDAETAQEPREVEQDSNAVDTREKLEADVRDFIYNRGWVDDDGYEETDAFIFKVFTEWLDRQMALTSREWSGYLDEAIEQLNEASEKVDELERENAKLSSDELHWRTQAQQADSVREARISKLLEQRDEARAEADYYRSLYERMAKAVDDVARNYTVVDEDGEVVS